MSPHVCPWWGGYFIDNRLRRLLHNPEKILAPHVEAGMTAIDFGCGMGIFAIAMARLVGDRGRVIAVDVQQQMLDVLSKRARKEGVGDRVDTHRCAADSLNLATPVDFILAFYSLHEVPNPARRIEELQACLRPGGRFLLVEPVGHVGRKQFAEFISVGEGVGLTIRQRPRVALSRAVLLGRDGDAGPPDGLAQ